MILCRYNVTSTIGHRIGRLNPDWNDENQDTDVCLFIYTCWIHTHTGPSLYIPALHKSVFMFVYCFINSLTCLVSLINNVCKLIPQYK